MLIYYSKKHLFEQVICSVFVCNVLTFVKWHHTKVSQKYIFPEIFLGPVLNLDWVKAFIVCSDCGKNHFVKVTDTSGNSTTVLETSLSVCENDMNR